MKKIPVSQPFLSSAETDNVNEAMRAGELSGHCGRFLPEFERSFAAFCGSKHGIAVSNGTTAIHLPLAAFNLKPGDEVLTSTLTNMATFFAVLYQGALPVPVDIEPDTLNMNPELLEALVTPRTKAILVVHLFGHPVDMDPVMAVAKKHNLAVIEDCAEAHGALYKGRKVGSIGDAGCFSFYANKIITTGEGGMVTAGDDALASRMRYLKTLAFGDKLKFMHKDLGYNYRLTNLQAAVGCAQLGKIDEIIANKRRIASYYSGKLAEVGELQLPVEKPYARNVFWMYHVVLRKKNLEQRTAIIKFMAEKGIEVREGFIPYNMQDVFIARGLVDKDACPVANSFAYNSFYLPSGPALPEADMDYVVESLKAALARH
jgi:perosamine synthetase